MIKDPVMKSFTAYITLTNQCYSCVIYYNVLVLEFKILGVINSSSCILVLITSAAVLCFITLATY